MTDRDISIMRLMCRAFVLLGAVGCLVLGSVSASPAPSCDGCLSAAGGRFVGSVAQVRVAGHEFTRQDTRRIFEQLAHYDLPFPEVLAAALQAPDSPFSDRFILDMDVQFDVTEVRAGTVDPSQWYRLALPVSPKFNARMISTGTNICSTRRIPSDYLQSDIIFDIDDNGEVSPDATSYRVSPKETCATLAQYQSALRSEMAIQDLPEERLALLERAYQESTSWICGGSGLTWYAAPRRADYLSSKDAAALGMRLLLLRLPTAQHLGSGVQQSQVQALRYPEAWEYSAEPPLREK